MSPQAAQGMFCFSVLCVYCFSLCLRTRTSQLLAKLEKCTDIPVTDKKQAFFLSLFSAFVRGDLECLRERARCEHSLLLPSAGECCFLRVHWEAPWARVTEFVTVTWVFWVENPFPVSLSPCFQLKVSPLAVAIRSQPPTCCVVFHHYHQNSDAKYNCPSILCHRVWKPVRSVWKRNESPEGNSLSCLIPTESPTGHTQVNIFCHEINGFNGLKITCGI